MTLQEYISIQHGNNPFWFEDEVSMPYHQMRIAKCHKNTNYLKGLHKVLGREDMLYKGEAYRVKKTLINYCKTVLRFHDSYLLGKPVGFSGDENTVKTLNDIARLGGYDSVDYEILDRVLKYGDAYEVIYQENGVIKSKVLDSADCYPIYYNGEYLGFIEHWTDVYTGITYYTVYGEEYTEFWHNMGGEYMMYDVAINVCGLPIHWHNFSDDDYCFGKDLLSDLIPIMDDIEDCMAKLGDAVYTLSMNPIPVATGQRIDSSIPADAVGYVLNLDVGNFEYASCSMDYNTINLYLDNMKKWLADVACFPSVFSSNGNIANVSEVSIRMLFHMASLLADENKKWLNKGYRNRLMKISQMLRMQGLDGIDDVEIIYNYNLPSATAETIQNLNVLKGMGAISVETVIEKSDMIMNKDVELQRLKEEEKKAEKKMEKAAERDAQRSMMQGNDNSSAAGKDGQKDDDDKGKADKKGKGRK